MGELSLLDVGVPPHLGSGCARGAQLSVYIVLNGISKLPG